MAGVTVITKEVEQRQEITLCSRIKEDSANLAETVAATKTQEGTENPMEQMEEPHKGPDLLVEDPWEDQTSTQIASQHLTGGEP